MVGVAIFARSPIAGRTKTRLIPALGSQGAAALYAWMTRRSVSIGVAVQIGAVSLFCELDARHLLFRSLATQDALKLEAQVAGDFVARM